MSARAALLAAAARRLAAAGVPEPMRDARLLLRHAAGLDAARFAAAVGEAPRPGEAARFEALIARRAAREPVSRILGERLFWGRSFIVTPDVLDPRPETETLIAAALDGPAPRRVLDLGVGSGCILLTLLAERQGARGVGVDLSAAALAVARRNAAALGVAERAELREGSWFAPVAGVFDLVVANPPYIPATELRRLDPEVREHEPAAALAGGGDGLAAYRAIAAGLAARLAPEGRALLEFGAGQGADVAAILSAAGMAVHRLHVDLDGRERVIELRHSHEKRAGARRIA